MKGRTLSILGIFAAAIGVVLLMCYKVITVSGVTITGGILFVAVGLINLLLLSSLTKSDSATVRVLTLVANAAAIVLGVSLLVFQSTFAPMIAFIFALLVAVCALWQFFVLAVGTRPYQLPAWLYLFPIALAAAAAYLFVRNPEPGKEDHILMLATGIAMAVLGLACVVEGSVLGVARRHSLKSQTAVPQSAPAVQEASVQPVEPEPAQTEEFTPKEEPQKRVVETTDDLDDEVN